MCPLTAVAKAKVKEGACTKGELVSQQYLCKRTELVMSIISHIYIHDVCWNIKVVLPVTA